MLGLGLVRAVRPPAAADARPAGEPRVVRADEAVFRAALAGLQPFAALRRDADARLVVDLPVLEPVQEQRELAHLAPGHVLPVRLLGDEPGPVLRVEAGGDF